MKLSDALALLLLSALWGGSFLFMRVAAPVLGPVWLIEIRVSLTVLLLLPLIVRLGLWPEIRKHWLVMLIVGGLGSAAPFTLISFATLSLPAGFTSILNATTPLFGAMVAAVWLKERLTQVQVASLGLGFVGVVVLVGFKATVTSAFLMAVGAGLLASVMYAISSPYAAKALVGVQPLAIAAGSQLGAAIWLLPALPFTVPTQTPSWSVVASVFGLAGFSTALAYILFFRLLQSIGSTRVLTVTYLIPLFAIAWGALLLGEAVTVSMLGGGLLILLSVAIANGMFTRLKR
ncbi:MAG: DMT family transporter [Phormidesmis sp.]